jgi:hypothetical protein
MPVEILVLEFGARSKEQLSVYVQSSPSRTHVVRNAMRGIRGPYVYRGVKGLKGSNPTRNRPSNNYSKVED